MTWSRQANARVRGALCTAALLVCAAGAAVAVAPAALAGQPATRAAVLTVPVAGPGAAGASAATPAAGVAGARHDPSVLPGAPSVDAGFTFNTVAVLLHLDRPYDPRLRVSLRASLNGVTWSSRQTLAFLRTEGRPGTAAHPGDTASQPLWVGSGRMVQYRLTLAGRPAPQGSVTHLRFAFIDTMGDGEKGTAATTSPAVAGTAEDAGAAKGPEASAGAAPGGAPVFAGYDPLTAATGGATFDAVAVDTSPPRPAIVTRAGWGADESWRRGRPQYARVRMAFIHHTAGTTFYTPEEAPAIVRAVYYYHTRVLGWSDVGYNFLIDRYGTIYQGRAGSMDRGVIGAQVLGFNTHSTGISLMGTLNKTQPTPAMLDSLERLLAWKLSLTHLDALGTATMLFSGSGKFSAGEYVRFRAVAAHREACYTDCPGNAMYARMTQVRRTTAALMHGRPLPLYVSAYAAPAAITPDGDGVDDSTTVSCYAWSPATLRVAVLDAGGNEVRLLQDWTTVATGIWTVGWDGLLQADGGPAAKSGTYTIEVDATDAAGHHSSARTTVVVNATIGAVGIAPATFSPNGDAVTDSTVITYTLLRDATPVVTVGPSSAPLFRAAPGRQSAGTYQVTWDGRDPGGAPAPDGTYTVTVRASDDTGRATVHGVVALDRIAPRPVAPSPALTVKHGRRLDVPYLERDPSAGTVRVRTLITDSGGAVRSDRDRGWVTTGHRHTLAFRSSVPGLYTLAVRARDHAGTPAAAPALIVIRVK